MKNLLITMMLLLTVTLGLNGCSSEPPVYESGMSKEEYREQFSSWFADKLSTANEAQVEKFREESVALSKNFKKDALKINSSEIGIKIVDNFIAKLITMTDNQFGLSQGDWEFIAFPKVGSGASKHSQAEIQYIIKLMITHPALASKYGVLPLRAATSISQVMKDKDDIYFQVLKESKYSKVIANDGWVKRYEAKKIILNTAKQMAQLENLDISPLGDVAENPRALEEKIKSLKFEYDFELINNRELIPFKYGRSIFELKSLLEPVSIDEFKSAYDPIKYAKRNLESAYKNLDEKKKYLSEHPDVGWAKTSVSKSEENVKQAEESLNQANTKFTIIYGNDIKKLGSNIQTIKKLQENIERYASKHSHNVRIFAKTYTNLLQQGYEMLDISEVLSNDRWFYKLNEYNTRQSLQLNHLDSLAFKAYMKTMRGLLKQDSTS